MTGDRAACVGPLPPEFRRTILRFSLALVRHSYFRYVHPAYPMGGTMSVLKRVAASIITAGALLAGPSAAPAAADSSQETTPLSRAHAHNDYEHQRPLFDAHEHGFTSAEVDIWLVDGELLVGHDREDLVPGRTIESLYLDPLMALVRQNRGAVFAGHDAPFQLLIDIKNTGPRTYEALRKTLRPYQRMLTRYVHGRVADGAVVAVVSGERDARGVMEPQPVRYAFYDGRLSDLGSDSPASFIPLISDNWTNHFTWEGVGPMPASERQKLHDIVETAHANGQRVRFWATPDADTPAREAVWRELIAADVDHINTDDLAGLAEFLREND